MSKEPNIVRAIFQNANALVLWRFLALLVVPQPARVRNKMRLFETLVPPEWTLMQMTVLACCVV